MKSHIFGSTGVNPSATVSNTAWIDATNGLSWVASTNAATRTTVIPHALTLDQLRVKVANAPGTGKSITLTVVQNGTLSALTVTISDTNTSGQDMTHSVSFAAGDTISMRTDVSGTPTLPSGLYWSIRQDAIGMQALLGGASNTIGSSSLFNGLQTTNSAWNATESNVYSPMPTAGVIKSLYIISSAAPGTGNDYAVTLVVNGSPTALTCSLGAAGTAAHDTTHSVSVSAGDTVSLQETATGSPSQSIKWGISFAPTNDGESVLLFGMQTNASTSTTNYNQPMGMGGAWGTTAPVAALMLAATTLKDIYVLLTTAPGGVKSYAFTVDINSLATLVTTTVTGSAVSNHAVGLSVAVNDDDLSALASIPTATPAVTTVKTGILMFISPSVVVADSGSTVLMMGV